MKTILLIRHGETQAPPGVFCGVRDVALSERGRWQSAQSLKLMIVYEVELVVTTGLQRSDYVGELAARSGMPHCIEKGFREVDFGNWEGLTWEQISHQYPEQADDWLETPMDMDFPCGERAADFLRRVERAWQNICSRPESVIGLVGHSGTWALLRRAVLGEAEIKYMNYGESVTLTLKGVQ